MKLIEILLFVVLKLFEFLCFVIYLVNLVFGKVYKLIFDEFGFMYMQYIMIIVLWEQDNQIVGQFGEKLFFEFNMLMLILKKFEVMGYLEWYCDLFDECQVFVSLMKSGCCVCEKGFDMNFVEVIGLKLDEFVKVQKVIVMLCGNLIWLIEV